jgi:hypothetical protein
VSGQGRPGAGPCGAPLFPWTFAMAIEAVAALALSRLRGAREPDRAGRWMPPVGALGRCPSRFPHGLSPLHRHRAPAGGG